MGHLMSFLIREDWMLLWSQGLGQNLGQNILMRYIGGFMLNFKCSCLVVVMDIPLGSEGNAIFLMICITEQASFAGQESFEIRREVCVPYPCRISCFRLFSVNSHLLFAFSYLIFIDLLCTFRIFEV
jgi:hypothetical protein